MEVLQVLQTRFDETIKSISNVVVETRELYEQERAINQATLEKFFTPEGDDQIRFSHFNLEVFTKDSKHSIITISVQDSYNENAEKSWTNLYINTAGYRTEGVDESIAERFEKQAYYTRMAIDFEDDIIAEFNQTRDKTKESIKVINLPVSKLSGQAENLREEIDTLRKLQQ
jgi:hypothetical protein